MMYMLGNQYKTTHFQHILYIEMKKLNTVRHKHL